MRLRRHAGSCSGCPALMAPAIVRIVNGGIPAANAVLGEGFAALRGHGSDDLKTILNQSGIELLLLAPSSINSYRRLCPLCQLVFVVWPIAKRFSIKINAIGPSQRPGNRIELHSPENLWIAQRFPHFSMKHRFEVYYLLGLVIKPCPDDGSIDDFEVCHSI